MPGDSTVRRPGRLALAACSMVALGIALPASGAGPASSLRQQAQQLTQENSAIASHSRAAVLTLYALDSRLTQAQGRLAAVRAQAAAVDRQAAETRRELGIARHLLTASQAHLATRLRALYEQGDSDPLAIVLGANTLDDALTALQTANAAAANDRVIVARARASRDRYVALRERLAARAEKLRALQASVSATVNSLASAKASRIAYLQQLTAQRSLNQSQIGSLESRAQAIEAKARQVAVAQTVSSVSSAPTPVAPTTSAGPGTMTVTATAYTLQGTTATGAPVGYGVVAVDPSVIPLGTRMSIPGYGEGVAADTGGAIQGATIDLWFPTAADAAAWGRRTVTITLH